MNANQNNTLLFFYIKEFHVKDCFHTLFNFLNFLSIMIMYFFPFILFQNNNIEKRGNHKKKKKFLMIYFYKYL